MLKVFKKLHFIIVCFIVAIIPINASSQEDIILDIEDDFLHTFLDDTRHDLKIALEYSIYSHRKLKNKLIKQDIESVNTPPAKAGGIE